MSKSFLYSLLIHLLLGSIIIVFLLQPTPKPLEHRICIQMDSIEQPLRPQCACTPQKTTPPPQKPAVVPAAVKPAVPIPVKTPIPVQNTKSTAPVIETPPSKPVASSVPAVAQSSTLSTSIKAPPSPPAPPPAPVNVEKEYIKLNLAEIRSLLIQHQQYPKMAKRLRMQGDVELRFQLNSNGSVEDLTIVQSSGFEILDEDARSLILKTAPLFPKPSKSVQLRLPISYILR